MEFGVSFELAHDFILAYARLSFVHSNYNQSVFRGCGSGWDACFDLCKNGSGLTTTQVNRKILVGVCSIQVQARAGCGGDILDPKRPSGIQAPDRIENQLSCGH
jgi:hypothetical protein